MNNLVIVESPTKARTLARFLGDKYDIEASMGHVRDLPKSEIGIDTKGNFEPRYIIPRDKSKQVKALQKKLVSAKTLWLATDPDREGEAIAWHLANLLDGKKPQVIKRVVFHEITPEAIQEAFNHPREIDMKLVDAQQARRVLDRLVGYKLSPLLWKKVKSGLSAGRVQSVALKLIVEREDEISIFKPVEYWSIDVDLETEKKSKLTVSLEKVNGKKAELPNQARTGKIVDQLKSSEYKIQSINKKEVKRYPAPPFTTSTLQQAASNRLGMSAKKTMMLAQHLYEQGLITYMRTDSVNLSSFALNAAREVIKSDYGAAYLPPQSRIFKTKSKVAQEAHEAIRPTNLSTTADKLKETSGITRDHLRVYDLIYKRMLASQISEAVLDQTTIEVEAKKDDQFLLKATGSVVKFDGWLKVYGVVSEEEEGSNEPITGSKILPEVKDDESLKLLEVLPLQHFTEPPPRFNEASLIKKLEELGIGRPSTYAPIISTIIDRFYIERMDRRFKPTELGSTVVKFLKEYFPDIIDYSFTATMEDNLDEVANGEKKWQPIIGEFYEPFEKKIEEVMVEAEKVKIEVEVTDELCPNCGKNLIVKFGRFGRFLACSGFPECKFTKPFDQKINITCPKCGSDVVMRRTKKGRPFYGCSNYPKCDFASWTKPKTDKDKDEKSPDDNENDA